MSFPFLLGDSLGSSRLIFRGVRFVKDRIWRERGNFQTYIVLREGWGSMGNDRED